MYLLTISSPVIDNVAMNLSLLLPQSFVCSVALHAHVVLPAQVIFEKEEVDSLKRFAEPGLLLLGFKPKDRLKPHYYVKPANFIYPDETVS